MTLEEFETRKGGLKVIVSDKAAASMSITLLLDVRMKRYCCDTGRLKMKRDEV